jgi:hypothetical protein
MDADDYFCDDKTTYKITDEDGQTSSITVDKWVADLLQENLPNVHLWIQEKYDLACKKLPHLTRRGRGNAVRERARQEAKKCPGYVPLIDIL